MARLLDRIKKRVAAEAGDGPKKRCNTPLPPPATRAEFAKAESQLGFNLPALLKELYTLIANGGFGPGRGLLGVPSRKTPGALNLVKEYRNCLRRPGLQWPAHLL